MSLTALNPSQSETKITIEISQILIEIGDCFLMQLRDFKPSIVYPGHWGFFAGHWEEGESAEDAMWRELQEELQWQPHKLRALGCIMVEGKRRIHAHYCHLNVPLEELSLQEGQEIGVFAQKQIASGALFSEKWNQHYPVSPISTQVFHHFVEKIHNV